MAAEGEEKKAAPEAEKEAPKEVEKEAPKEAAAGLKPKVAEKPKEVEEDAPADKRKTISSTAACIDTTDATLNVMPTANGKVLMTLMEGGFQYLLAGARTTVGLKSGRYLFEVKIVESHRDTTPQQAQGRVPLPRNIVRLGLSSGGTSLFLGDGSADNVSFDSEGFFIAEKNRKKVTVKSERDTTLGLLVNLDQSSPQANTVSLFRNGARACEPQPIPEALRGKPLFPTVTYKNVTLQLNLGTVPLAPLPFTCRMVSEAAVADVEVVTIPEPKGGKPEVVFPVGLPEHGFFDWVDIFLQQNPGFTELSDRKILDWAAKSGLWRQSKGIGASADKPDMKFGIPLLDDLSVRRVLQHIAPTSRRSFVIPELRGNLLAAERKQALARWPLTAFKKTAAIIAGEPKADFKSQVQGLILADKKEAALAELKKKREEEARKRVAEEKKKAAEAAQKARQLLLKRKREGTEGEEEPAPVEEAKEEPTEEPMEVTVELTDEEKAMTFRKTGTVDVAEQVLSRCYADFTFPTSEEGFDEVSYKWQDEAACAKLLKDWIFAKKLTQRVDDIKPGAAFAEALPKWTKVLADWRKRQNEWKDPVKKKAFLAARAEAKKKAAAEAAEKGDEAPAEDKEIDPEDLDVASVEDVTDIGNGEPLFANFAFEDWLMLAARYEFHLLVLSFKKDLDDADRPSFTTKDFAFYYQKYFKKAFNVRSFARDKVEQVVDLMKDTIKIDASSSFLTNVLAEDTDVAQFVKLAEDHRRERTRRMDAGDETAELKFPKTGVPTQPAMRPGVPSVAAVRPGMPGLAPRMGGLPAGAVGGVKRPLAPAAPAVSTSYVAKQPRVSPYGRFTSK